MSPIHSRCSFQKHVESRVSCPICCCQRSQRAPAAVPMHQSCTWTCAPFLSSLRKYTGGDSCFRLSSKRKTTISCKCCCWDVLVSKTIEYDGAQLQLKMLLVTFSRIRCLWSCCWERTQQRIHARFIRTPHVLPSQSLQALNLHVHANAALGMQDAREPAATCLCEIICTGRHFN